MCLLGPEHTHCSEEAWFILKGYVNISTTQHWYTENPNAVHEVTTLVGSQMWWEVCVQPNVFLQKPKTNLTYILVVKLLVPYL
jgi:hypothetical protein